MTKNLFYTSSIQEKPKGYSSRKLETTMTKVKENIEEDLTLSTRWLSAFTTTPITTVWRAIKTNNFKSYKMVSIQQLLPVDHLKRRQFCLDEVERITKNSWHLDKIIFSDKAHFHLDGGVSRYN